MKPFIINRTNLRLKTRGSCIQSQINSVIHEFKRIFMTLCLNVGINDMWAIELVKEMYLTLPSIL